MRGSSVDIYGKAFHCLRQFHGGESLFDGECQILERFCAVFETMNCELFCLLVHHDFTGQLIVEGEGKGSEGEGADQLQCVVCNQKQGGTFQAHIEKNERFRRMAVLLNLVNGGKP